jgi:hypothetical protein
MRMHYHLSDFALWLVTPILQAAVLVAMFRRNFQHSYRYFLAYTVLQVAAVPILAVVMFYSYSAYYYAYYVNLGLSILVSFAVVWEILKTVFRWNQGRRRWGAIPLLCAAVLLVAAIEMILNSQASRRDAGYVTDLMMLGDRSVRFAQLGIALGALFFANRLGVSRRSFLYGVVAGFGFFATTNMIIAMRLSHRGSITSPTLSRINSVAYLTSVVIWLFYSIYGSMDASGYDRAPLYSSSSNNNRRGPKRPNRWFFRLGSSPTHAAAGD